MNQLTKAVAFALLSWGLMAAPANTAELPKSGTASIHSGWYFNGAATQVDEKRMYFEGTWWGVSFNNAGDGLLHHAAWNCPAITEVVDGKMSTEGARCTLTDPKGDKMFGTWTGRGMLGGEFAGELTFTGGTGQYQGIAGGLKFSCFDAGTSGVQVHCTQEVTYKLP